MKRLHQLLAVTGFASALLLCAGNLTAQDTPPGGERGGGRGGRGGGGNFDPAQMQQRMLERTKEQLEVTDETEWKALEPLVQKVMDARRESMMGGMGGMMRGFGRQRGGDAGGGGGAGGGSGGDQQRRPSFFGEPSAEAQALEKAIESKASKEELKAAMAKVRASKKEKEAKLKEAQESLRKVLTLRQEAIAVSNSLLD